MTTSKMKVFLIQPEHSYPEKLIYSDNEDTARSNAGSMLAQRIKPGDKIPLLNDDPYLRNTVKVTSVQTEILDESNSGILHCKFNNKEYFLSKNMPVAIE